MTTKTPLVALSERLLQQQPGFDDARSSFYKKKTELNDIRQVIATTHDKKRAAEEQAVMDDKGWRKRFRKAKGELTPEMQDLHTRTSRYLTEQTKEVYYQCQNIDSSSTFKTRESIEHVIRQPLPPQLVMVPCHRHHRSEL